MRNLPAGGAGAIRPSCNGRRRIGEFWSHPQSREFAVLLIDGDEDGTLRVVLVGMLREANR